MGPHDQLLLVERNQQFVARLRRRLADEPAFRSVAKRVTLIAGSVEELPEDDPFDFVVSGLPLNNFSAELVNHIVKKLRRLLTPSGTLSFFEYVAIRRAKSLLSARGERKRLRGVEAVLAELLTQHEIDRDLVLANVPPAWVHHVRFAPENDRSRN
jgi:phosphatidylserine decarboxylase